MTEVKAIDIIFVNGEYDGTEQRIMQEDVFGIPSHAFHQTHEVCIYKRTNKKNYRGYFIYKYSHNETDYELEV